MLKSRSGSPERSRGHNSKPMGGFPTNDGSRPYRLAAHARPGAARSTRPDARERRRDDQLAPRSR